MGYRKDIMIANEVGVFKVADSDNRMSTAGENGSQRGKDITIETFFNREKTAQDWVQIMEEVTLQLRDANIPPGYQTIREGQGLRADIPLQGSNYVSYRYEGNPTNDPFLSLQVNVPDQQPNQQWAANVAVINTV